MSWYELVELDDGIYAVIDKDGGWFLSNTGIIDLGDSTVIIDAQYNGKRAADIFKILQDKGLKPPLHLVLTHHHGDHIWGTHRLPARDIIMHENARTMAEQLEQLNIRELYAQFFPHLDFSDSKYTPPTLTIKGEELVIRGQTRNITIRYLGPAHTVGDMIVIVDNIVFTGDILFNKVTPFALDGTMSGWIKTLEFLPKAEKYVPGHGPVGDATIIEDVKEYLELILEEAKKHFEKGIDDPVSIGEKTPLGKFKEWKHPERVYFNLERALMDLKQIPPGTPTPRLLELARFLQR